MEETAQKLATGQRTNKRQISAVIGIELGLLMANGFAAHRAAKIGERTRRSAARSQRYWSLGALMQDSIPLTLRSSRRSLSMATSPYQ